MQLASDFLKGLVDLGDSVDGVIVLELKADGAVDRPGRVDSSLLLDVVQLDERGLGEVLKKGEPHAGSLLAATPGVVGGGGSRGVRLPRGKFLAVSENQVSPVSGKEPGNHRLRTVAFTRKDVSRLEQGLAVWNIDYVILALGALPLAPSRMGRMRRS